MTASAVVDQVYLYLPQTNEILVQGNDRISRFPVYTLEDLLNWRQE